MTGENLDTTGVLPGIPPAAILPAAPLPDAPAWKGNRAYFQSGEKQGQKKPTGKRIRNRAKKSPEKNTQQPAKPNSAGPDKIAGLRFDELKFTKTTEQTAVDEADPEGLTTEDKKLLNARGQAGLALQLFDMVADWISGGTFGEGLSTEAASKHNKRRAKFEDDLAAYLETVDLPMHPLFAVAVSGMAYMGPALKTEKGKEKAATFRDKIISKSVGWIFNRGKK